MRDFEAIKAIKELSVTYSAINHEHYARNIIQDASNRFITDSERQSWNAKASSIQSGSNGAITFSTISATNGSINLDGVSFNLLEVGNIDLNTLKTSTNSKFYVQSNSSYSTTANNYPMQSKGILKILSTGNYSIQIFHPLDLAGNSYYVRYYTGTLWTSWTKVYTSGNLPTLTELDAASSTHLHDANYVKLNETITVPVGKRLDLKNGVPIWGYAKSSGAPYNLLSLTTSDTVLVGDVDLPMTLKSKDSISTIIRKGTTNYTYEIYHTGNLSPGVLENRTTDPASPAVGYMWLRTDL